MSVAVGAKEIQEFYDGFLRSQMLSYRLHRNARIERAAARILPYVARESRVLDIGCGIGILAERISARAKLGHVWACDISEKNVWYAEQTVRASNVTFFVSDVARDFDGVRRRLPGPVDVVTLVDVIEHLPPDLHAELFANLGSISSGNAVLVITYPSPAYQRFLRENHPDRLQIVDEIVELPDLIDAARAGGYEVRHFSLEDVWMRNQYVHCVLELGSRVAPIARQDGWMGRLARLGSRIVDRSLRVPLRRRRYVDQVFGRGAPPLPSPSPDRGRDS